MDDLIDWSRGSSEPDKSQTEDLNQSGISETLENIMRKDFPIAENWKARARKSRKFEDFEIAVNHFMSILEKFDRMDSPDIYLMGFGFECFKSAIFIQLLLNRDQEASILSTKLALEECKNHDILPKEVIQQKLTSGIFVEENILEFLPWEKITYNRFELLILSVFLLIKVRFLSDLLSSDHNMTVRSFQIFIKTLETHPQRSTHRKLAAQQPAMDLISQYLKEETVEIQCQHVQSYIKKIIQLIQPNILNRSTEMEADETWLILDEGVRLFCQNCDTVNSRPEYSEHILHLKEIIKNVKSMFKILVDINCMWGTWTN